MVRRLFDSSGGSVSQPSASGVQEGALLQEAVGHQKIHNDKIKPVSITVTDNVAIVNFYKTTRREDENGNRLTYRKVTRICFKENGKWLILGNRAAAINEG